MYGKDFKLNFEYWDEDDVSTTSISIYLSDGDVYYDRASEVCSTRYYCTYKFGLGELKSVLHYIADNGCAGLEDYIEGLDGSVLVSYDRIT